MGIKESLDQAEQEYSEYIRWGLVVTLLAQQNQVTEKEAARWLLLHNAHVQFSPYFLEPHIPRVTSQSKDDHKTNKIEEILEAFIFKATPPSYTSVLNNLLGINLQHDKKDSNYGVRLELLNKFLTEDDLPALIIDNQKTQPTDNELKLTKPQQREIALLEYLKSDDGFGDILKLPTMAKKQAREYLTKNQAKLFTDSTFDQAWASLSGRGHISLADKKKYLSK